MLEPAALGATGSAAAWPAERWWAAWGDAGLDAIVDQALAGSPSLKSAEERVRLAQAAADAAGAARQPQANLSVELTDQRFTENGLVPPPLAGTIRWNNSAQIGVGWELDLFGRQRAALDAAIGSRALRRPMRRRRACCSPATWPRPTSTSRGWSRTAAWPASRWRSASRSWRWCASASPPGWTRASSCARPRA